MKSGWIWNASEIGRVGKIEWNAYEKKGERMREWETQRVGTISMNHTQIKIHTSKC